MIKLPGNAMELPGPGVKLIAPINCSTPPAPSTPNEVAQKGTGEQPMQDTNGATVVSERPASGPPKAVYVIRPVVRKFICACELAKLIFPPKPALLRNDPIMPTPTAPGSEGEN